MTRSPPTPPSLCGAALLGAILTLGCSPPAAPPPKPPDARGPPPRHLLLVLLDTFRADVAEEVDTPALDALAAAGARAPDMWAAGTWTLPSVISLFTGMGVRQHGWNEPSARLGHYPPLPDVPTLAEVLGAAGFVTESYYANPYLSEKIGISRGFATWRRSVDRKMPEQLAASVSGWSDGARHFAYVHMIGPHSPLTPDPEAVARLGLDPTLLDEKGQLEIGKAKRNRPQGAREAYALAYRAEVEEVDARVGELLAALGPERARTLVVLTADHGELLGEHEVVGHGHHVWRPLRHVPLIVDDPRVPATEEALPQHLGTAAVAPMITELLGVDHAWPQTPALPLVSSREDRLALSPDGRLVGVWEPEGLEVFDLSTDPGELHPLPEDHGLPAARAAWEAATPPGVLAKEEVATDAERVQELEQLGYVADEASP